MEMPRIKRNPKKVAGTMSRKSTTALKIFTRSI